MGEWFGYTSQGNAAVVENRQIFNVNGYYPCPSDGYITKVIFDFVDGAGHTFKFIITELVSGTTYHLKAVSELLTGANGPTEYELVTPLSIEAGDCIGVEQDSTTKTHRYTGVNGIKYFVPITVCTNSGTSERIGFAIAVQAYVETIGGVAGFSIVPILQGMGMLR